MGFQTTGITVAGGNGKDRTPINFIFQIIFG
jgi:hypothetical protein